MSANILAAILDKEARLGAVDSLLLALIGIVIVFIVLIALMLVVTLQGKIFDGSAKLKQKHPEWAEKAAAIKSKFSIRKKEELAEEAAPEELASGTCGELVLVGTSERDAAMIMAIVADNTNTPLNQLRFKSIKRVEDENL